MRNLTNLALAALITGSCQVEAPNMNQRPEIHRSAIEGQLFHSINNRLEMIGPAIHFLNTLHDLANNSSYQWTENSTVNLDIPQSGHLLDGYGIFTHIDEEVGRFEYSVASEKALQLSSFDDKLRLIFSGRFAEIEGKSVVIATELNAIYERGEQNQKFQIFRETETYRSDLIEILIDNRELIQLFAAIAQGKLESEKFELGTLNLKITDSGTSVEGQDVLIKGALFDLWFDKLSFHLTKSGISQVNIDGVVRNKGGQVFAKIRSLPDSNGDSRRVVLQLSFAANIMSMK